MYMYIHQACREKGTLFCKDASIVYTRRCHEAELAPARAPSTPSATPPSTSASSPSPPPAPPPGPPPLSIGHAVAAGPPLARPRRLIMVSYSLRIWSGRDTERFDSDSLTI